MTIKTKSVKIQNNLKNEKKFQNFFNWRIVISEL